jgi:ABC-type transport system involved in cytochrome c biogenesis permease component
MSELSSAVESATLGGVNSGKDPNAPKLRIAADQTGKLGRFNEWFSEWCSSILVKETRQALKSRQFIWTYFVLLLSVGVWTVLGMSVNRNDYNAGRELLLGFWWILGFPLGLIIPFSAYRSLAREFEDGTIQLISITTMKPYQIVIGKFGSAILQMLIYLSVLAPCISFTYLLRGISLEMILMGSAICVGGSVCLTIVGLFLAGAFRSRALGIGVSVLFVLALGWLYFGWCAISYEFTTFGGSLSTNEPEMRAVIFGMVAFFGSTAALLLVAAAAQISFPSDNRSTSVRIMMLVQQTLFFALMIVVVSEVLPFLDDFFLGMIFVVGHYWLIMGFLMIGESSVVSRRVQRTLPRTFFSKSFFSLLMPGAGRGFLFAVANVWACFLGMVLIGLFSRYLSDEAAVQQAVTRWGAGWNQSLSPEMVGSSAVCCLYVTWFLAVIYLTMRLFFEKRKRDWSTGVGPLVSLIAGALLIAAMTIFSFIIHFNFFDWRNGSDSSPVLVLNWYWSTVEISQGNNFYAQLVWFAMFALQAVIVILLAFRLASRELLYRPIAVPQRVALELQAKPSSVLPVGESIEEIFGELDSGKEPTDAR